MKLKNLLIDILVLMIISIPIASAIDLDQPISDADKEKFDQILSPVMKVYGLIKYSATAVAAMMLMFAGITYMSSGSDPKKRDNAKSMGTFVVVGLVLIWATPALISFLVG